MIAVCLHCMKKSSFKKSYEFEKRYTGRYGGINSTKFKVVYECTSCGHKFISLSDIKYTNAIQPVSIITLSVILLFNCISAFVQKPLFTMLMLNATIVAALFYIISLRLKLERNGIRLASYGSGGEDIVLCEITVYPLMLANADCIDCHCVYKLRSGSGEINAVLKDFDVSDKAILYFIVREDELAVIAETQFEIYTQDNKRISENAVCKNIAAASESY